MMSKKTRKSKVCIECGHEHTNEWYEENPPLNKKNRMDVKLTEEYCEYQMRIYTHKNCKPVWCDECQNLTEYLVNY